MAGVDLHHLMEFDGVFDGVLMDFGLTPPKINYQSVALLIPRLNSTNDLSVEGTFWLSPKRFFSGVSWGAVYNCLHLSCGLGSKNGV